MNVNWSRIESFTSLDDPEEVEWLKDMLKSLIDNMKDRTLEISQFQSSKDLSKAQSVLHQIKGVAANFGLDNLHKQSSDAEQKAKEGDLDTCLSLSSEISPLWESARKELTDRFPV